MLESTPTTFRLHCPHRGVGAKKLAAYILAGLAALGTYGTFFQPGENVAASAACMIIGLLGFNFIAFLLWHSQETMLSIDIRTGGGQLKTEQYFNRVRIDQFHVAEITDVITTTGPDVGWGLNLELNRQRQIRLAEAIFGMDETSKANSQIRDWLQSRGYL